MYPFLPPRSTAPFLILCSTLFYVLAVFIAGLLVNSSDPRLSGNVTDNEGRDMVLKSPFVIAFQDSKIKHLDTLANAAFVLSAFSAATSDGARFPHFLPTPE